MGVCMECVRFCVFVLCALAVPADNGCDKGLGRRKHQSVKTHLCH